MSDSSQEPGQKQSSSERIEQHVQGDRNQLIGQVIGGVVVYLSGQSILSSTSTELDPSAFKITSSDIGLNPYKGLLAFQETDVDRFFGRETQIAKLWEKFRSLYEQADAIRVLPIYGPSGSGKSSLARAGLIPELARRPIPGYGRAQVAVLVPGTHPLEALATVLARIVTQDLTPVAKTREFAWELKQVNEAREYDGLRRIADVMPDIVIKPLIVLVDQFEEVYTLCKDQAERDAFVENLLCAASERSKRVSVIITLRSDFLGETQKHPLLNRLFYEQGFLVLAMTKEELRQAIQKPAELAGHPLDKSTIDLLIKDTEGREGALPLLQFALTRIWEGLAQGISPSETLEHIGALNVSLIENIYQIRKRPQIEQRLLNKVKQEIFSRLSQTLNDGVLINLLKELQPEQVGRYRLKSNDSINEPLITDLSILEIFEQADIDGRLLILGDTGSGKTTTLLELAQSLIVRAERQYDYPIPVLLNLRSWKTADFLSKNFPAFSRILARKSYQNLDEWLIVELKLRYNIQPDISRQLIEGKKILPMLDGLDEVQAKELKSCIEAINNFLKNFHSYCVVCSRTANYFSVSTRLSLNGAICLKPLTQDQIFNYFRSQDCSRLYQVVYKDPELLEVVRTPLSLTIATLIYRESSEELSILKTSKILEGVDSSQIESIKQLVFRAKTTHVQITTYALRLITSTNITTIGELIKVSIEVFPCTDYKSNCYFLEILNSETTEQDLSILLNAPGFQFDGTNVVSLPINTTDSNQNYSQTLQTAHFSLTALRSGSSIIRAEIYYGETFKTVLETAVRVSFNEGISLNPLIAARSRPVPQPDLTLQIQTTWNDRSSLVSFQYHLGSFHPLLRFASGIRQASTPLLIESLEQTRDLLQSTLENFACGLPEDFHAQFASLGQYLFQRFLPPELQQTFRTLMRFNQSFTLLILADQDAWLPWELLHDGQHFLGERLIIGRWAWELDQIRPYEFAIGAVNVAHYANVEQPELWASLLAASDAPPPISLSGGIFADLSIAEAMRGLHLVRLGLSPNAIDRQDTPVPLDSKSTEDLELELQPVKLNLRRNRPLVSLSYLSAGLPELTTLEQAWAATFIRGGCSAFVGPLWAVAPTVEAAFVSSFYHHLWAGDSLGMAFQAARRTAQSVAPDSLDWMAYVLFGDPMARPYRPTQGKGYAVVEPIGQEITDPVAPGASVRFRTSLRRTPPVWYDNRLMDIAEDLTFNDLQVYVVASGLQVIPADAIAMQRTPTGDYVGWFTLTVPTDRSEPSALVQVHFEDEMEPIHSLRFSLTIAYQEEQA